VISFPSFLSLLGWYFQTPYKAPIKMIAASREVIPEARALPREPKAIPCKHPPKKLNIMKVNRGCGSFDCSCEEAHSIPFKVEGKCSSVEVVLMPAPQGSGLVAGDELKKILKLAGIKDIYSQSWGQKRSTINFAKACIEALQKTGEFK